MMFLKYSTFDVHLLYTLSVQRDLGEDIMKLFEYMTVSNKQIFIDYQPITQSKTNDERTCYNKYRLSCKKLRFIDINIKRGEQNTGAILCVDILFIVKLVKILVYEWELA